MKKFFIDFLVAEVLRGEITKGCDVADYILKQGALLNLEMGYLTDIAVVVQQCERPEDIIAHLVSLRCVCESESKRVAEFSKVSYEQFKKDLLKSYASYWSDEKIREAYNKIELPTRATVGSAGYDIITPIDICLNPGQTVTMPTGIRCAIRENWVLEVFPKSGLGYKYRALLDNTVGIIDSDYYFSDNEGHIMAKITNNSEPSVIENKMLEVPAGKAFCQGIFHEYGITANDNADGVRNGGFGSTNK